ncbi:16316_t:CDS:2 [Funneliformis geosporum]|uniref:16316_t:CDS:1 n=1 Tax=Funneliformis geosporum TaxID=1117311 RepID=A0A9W4SFT4_9GLOM|nr:16316_t:CDS:2 [Funneliformis geosporum]
MSTTSASPQKKRRLSNPLAEDRRVEPTKKPKQDNPNGVGIPNASNKTEMIPLPALPTLPMKPNIGNNSNFRAGTSTSASSNSNIPPKTTGQSGSNNISISTSEINRNKDKEKDPMSASTTSPTSPVKGKGMQQQQIHQRTSSISSTYTQQPSTPMSQIPPQELFVRYTKKEEEIQTLLGELQTLSQILTPEFAYDPSLRKKFLDPAINVLFRTMKKELEDKDKLLENLQRELDGVSFTPNSITGKKLVAKLLALQNENEELGRQLRQGRVEQYEVEIALQRKVIDELKQGLEESDNQLISLDAEMERLQNLLFQMRAKVKGYEEKYGPLETDNKDDIAEISTNTVNEVSEIGF